jgi:YYY domain-containing protein
LLDVLAVFAALLFVGVLVYLPFYTSFRSQAGGIGWVGTIKTRLHQYLIMMGIFVFMQIGFLLSLVTYQRRRRDVVGGLPLSAKWVAGLIAPLTLFCLLQQWLMAAFVWATVAISAALWLWGSQGGWGKPLTPSTSFALLLVTAGLALTGSVEFIFLRDTFGTRMNTIFKFYYQAWVLLGIASAYGVFHVLHRWERLGSVLGRVAAGAWLAVSGMLVLAGLSYTIAAMASKAGGFRGEPTLDGTRYVRQYREADYEAIQWLEANAQLESVLLEAPGGSYSEYNWVSAHTGIPTVLGWGGHELQWRGNYDEAGRREPDIATIYQSLDRAQKRQLLEKYGVDFVYVGPLERRKYGLNPAMIGTFDSFMKRCYEGNGVIIYCWSP